MPILTPILYKELIKVTKTQQKATKNVKMNFTKLLNKRVKKAVKTFNDLKPERWNPQMIAAMVKIF